MDLLSPNILDSSTFQLFISDFRVNRPCPMPWLWGLATVALVLADPKLAVNKWSGCGEVWSLDGHEMPQ